MSARRRTAKPRLRSGMEGNGGKFAPNNGHADIPPDRNSVHARPATPYAVIGTTASSWSTRVSNNTTRLYREER